jgi:hypothetical protein
MLVLLRCKCYIIWSFWLHWLDAKSVCCPQHIWFSLQTPFLPSLICMEQATAIGLIFMKFHIWIFTEMCEHILICSMLDINNKHFMYKCVYIYVCVCVYTHIHTYICCHSWYLQLRQWSLWCTEWGQRNSWSEYSSSALLTLNFTIYCILICARYPLWYGSKSISEIAVWVLQNVTSHISGACVFSVSLKLFMNLKYGNSAGIC